MWTELHPVLAGYIGLSVLIGISSGVINFLMEHRPMDFDWWREARTWGRYLGQGERLNSSRNILIFLIGVPLLWPCFLAMIIHDYVKSDYKNGLIHFNNDPARQFKCQPIHLLHKVQPEDVEAASRIHDPLGRTPNQPLGHLFGGWCAFLAKKTPSLSLWEFAIPADERRIKAAIKSQEQVAQPIYRGYALVCRRSIRAEFFVSWSDQA